MNILQVSGVLGSLWKGKSGKDGGGVCVCVCGGGGGSSLNSCSTHLHRRVKSPREDRRERTGGNRVVESERL